MIGATVEGAFGAECFDEEDAGTASAADWIGSGDVESELDRPKVVWKLDGCPGRATAELDRRAKNDRLFLNDGGSIEHPVPNGAVLVWMERWLEVGRAVRARNSEKEGEEHWNWPDND